MTALQASLERLAVYLAGTGLLLLLLATAGSTPAHALTLILP